MVHIPSQRYGALPTSDHLEPDIVIDEASHASSVLPTEKQQRPTIGRRTTALLIGFYLIGKSALQHYPTRHCASSLTHAALLAAILHFVMMHYLDGKPTDDKKFLAQPYVTSLSLLLVTLFKACLCGSFAIAFTQHLWRVLRIEALRISSIESLHGVRYNPFLLGHWRILHATPLLYLMAMVMVSVHSRSARTTSSDIVLTSFVVATSYCCSLSTVGSHHRFAPFRNSATRASAHVQLHIWPRFGPEWQGRLCVTCFIFKLMGHAKGQWY